MTLLEYRSQFPHLKPSNKVLWNGARMEVISWPYDEGGVNWVLIRIPDNPDSVMEVNTSYVHPL